MKARLILPNKNDRKGPILALIAAALFGASAPLAKLLLNQLSPILLAALLYLGSGVGLSGWLWLRRSMSAGKSTEARLKRQDLPWLGSAILAGGILGPILLLIGLRVTPASSASLLLNLEGVFTALLAWFVFKENFRPAYSSGDGRHCRGSGLLSPFVQLNSAARLSLINVRLLLDELGSNGCGE